MIALVCALLSGAMFYFAFGLDDVWMLAWVAPAPLLWLAYGTAPRWQVAAASFFAAAMGTVYIFQAYGTYVLVAGIAMLIANGLLLGIAVLLAAQTRRAISGLAAVGTFPALWTSIEFAQGWISPHGAWGAMGYTQAAWPAAIQLASVAGVYGVTFLLCLFANAIALALRGERLAGGVGAALTVVVVAGGYARLASSQPAPLRVAAVAIVGDERSKETDLDVARRYAAAIRAEAAKGVKVVVTPETAIQADALAPVEAASAETGTLVVAGAHNRAPQRNMAVVFRPGAQSMTYDKRHLLLPGEAVFTPGTRTGIIGKGMATAICKDLDFPRTIRGDAQAGIRLMMVPANDFTLDDWMHARQAVMRGVENGFAVLRVASHGLATVSDDRGRVLARAQVRRPGLAIAQADVPLGSGPTFYTGAGDWFSWLCVALAIGMSALSLATRARRSSVAGAMARSQQA
jgi:apolipoprotein N-acyltransferase